MNRHPKKQARIRIKEFFGRIFRANFFRQWEQATNLAKRDVCKADIQDLISPASDPHSISLVFIFIFAPHPEQKVSSWSAFSPQLLQYIFHNPYTLKLELNLFHEGLAWRVNIRARKWYDELSQLINWLFKNISQTQLRREIQAVIELLLNPYISDSV